MAPLLRLEYPGAVYHFTSHANGRSKIFHSNTDLTTLLSKLAAVIQKQYAYCLMDSHYHPVVEPPDADLTMGISW